jgi:hypothetical protein
MGVAVVDWNAELAGRIRPEECCLYSSSRAVCAGLDERSAPRPTRYSGLGSANGRVRRTSGIRSAGRAPVKGTVVIRGTLRPCLSKAYRVFELCLMRVAQQ